MAEHPVMEYRDQRPVRPIESSMVWLYEAVRLLGRDVCGAALWELGERWLAGEDPEAVESEIFARLWPCFDLGDEDG